jgi:hypothetical protein
MLMPGLAPGIGFFSREAVERDRAQRGGRASLLAAEIKNRPQEPLPPVLSALHSHGRATLSWLIRRRSAGR